MFSSIKIGDAQCSNIWNPRQILSHEMLLSVTAYKQQIAIQLFFLTKRPWVLIIPQICWNDYRKPQPLPWDRHNRTIKGCCKNNSLLFHVVGYWTTTNSDYLKRILVNILSCHKVCPQFFLSAYGCLYCPICLTNNGLVFRPYAVQRTACSILGYDDEFWFISGNCCLLNFVITSFVLAN